MDTETNVFFSWSGQRSRELAALWADWLPSVLQTVRPFFSPDIEKGQQWSKVLSEQLERHHYGIVFLTPENLKAPWIMYEAGALSKLGAVSRLSILLTGMSAKDVEFPLAQFQVTHFNAQDVQKLLTSVNANLPHGVSNWKRAFDQFWPELERDVTGVLNQHPTEPTPIQRTLEDMVSELLATSRDTRWRAARTDGDATVAALWAELQDLQLRLRSYRSHLLSLLAPHHPDDSDEIEYEHIDKKVAKGKAMIAEVEVHEAQILLQLQRLTTQTT